MNDDRRESLSTLGFCAALSQYFAAHHWPLVFTLIACAVETGFYWIIPLAFRRLIDHSVAGESGRNLTPVLGLLMGGGVIASVASLWRGRAWARLENQVMSDLRFRLFQQAQRVSQARDASHTSTEALSSFSNDLSAVGTALTMAVVWGVLPGLDCIIGTVILAVLDWRLAALASLVWPWCLLAPPRIARSASSAACERKEREAELLEVVQEETATHAVVRAFGLERLRMMRFFGADARLFERSVETSFLTALMDQATFSGILLLQVLTLCSGAALVYSGKMTVGTLAAFQALFLSVSNSLNYSAQYVRGLLPARAAMQRVQAFLDRPATIEDAAEAPRLGPFTDAIEFDQVTVAYAGHVALRSVSLRIQRGSNVAIVGPSGSGKSTLISLLLRFQDPTSGAIRVDGRDLRAVTQESWRSQLGVVFQEGLLFRDSVGENIRMGRPDATEEAIVEAARQAGIHETLMRLPDGYRTAVGERGGRLSGGERQRIALARALVRQPSVLVLDEATSALDAHTEAAVNQTLRQVGRGRTVISVSHRLYSIADCDRIFVFDRGELVEQGTHVELLRGGGVYAALWRTSERERAGAAAAAG